eukprot:scaffold98170_cov70-Attheya_sp.AAC.1
MSACSACLASSCVATPSAIESCTTVNRNSGIRCELDDSLRDRFAAALICCPIPMPALFASAVASCVGSITSVAAIKPCPS